MTVLPTNLKAAVWWAYDILMNQTPVGSLQNFSPTQAKTIERVRQIFFSDNTNGGGPRVIDMVPGITDISATVERIRMFESNLLQAMDLDEFSLEDINDPFTILESLHRPSGGDIETSYSLCLFSEFGHAIQIGTSYIMERATVQIGTVTRNGV